jgi:hypothetical protein
MIEVAEHLPDPRRTLTEAFRLLKPGGVLYVTTPNFSSFRALLLREHWEAVIPTGHLYYFTADSLGKLLISIGFGQPSNFTAPAEFDFEVDGARANGGLRISPADLEEVRRQAVAEQSSQLFNGRGVGLVMWATKPRSTRDAIIASLRYSGPLPKLDNRLVCAPNTNGEVYLVREGRKHWVTSVDWLHKRGMRLEQTFQIDRELLSSIPTGPPLA